METDQRSSTARPLHQLEDAGDVAGGARLPGRLAARPGPATAAPALSSWQRT